MDVGRLPAERRMVGMTDPVTLTLVRYPPRNLAWRRGRRHVRVPLRRIGAAAACLLWLPAGFHFGMAGGRHRDGGGCRGVAAYGSARGGRRAAGAGVPAAVAAGSDLGGLRGACGAGAGCGGGNGGAGGIGAVGRGGSWGGGEPVGVADVRASERAALVGRVKPERGLLADHPVAIAIVHMSVGRMAAGHRRDAVAPGLLTGDAAVPIVVEQGEGIG